MTERTCIFAYTPNEPEYPPCLNLTVEDGKVIVIMRGQKRTPDETDYPFTMPGHTVRMELPLAQRDLLVTALEEQRHREIIAA